MQIVSQPYSISWSFHQSMLSDFLDKLSLIHPEIGNTGIFYSPNFFFRTASTNMLFISLVISS